MMPAPFSTLRLLSIASISMLASLLAAGNSMAFGPPDPSKNIDGGAWTADDLENEYVKTSPKDLHCDWQAAPIKPYGFAEKIALDEVERKNSNSKTSDTMGGGTRAGLSQNDVFSQAKTEKAGKGVGGKEMVPAGEWQYLPGQDPERNTEHHNPLHEYSEQWVRFNTQEMGIPTVSSKTYELMFKFPLPIQAYRVFSSSWQHPCHEVTQFFVAYGKIMLTRDNPPLSMVAPPAPKNSTPVPKARPELNLNVLPVNPAPYTPAKTQKAQGAYKPRVGGADMTFDEGLAQSGDYSIKPVGGSFFTSDLPQNGQNSPNSKTTNNTGGTNPSASTMGMGARQGSQIKAPYLQALRGMEEQDINLFFLVKTKHGTSSHYSKMYMEVPETFSTVSLLSGSMGLEVPEGMGKPQTKTTKTAKTETAKTAKTDSKDGAAALTVINPPKISDEIPGKGGDRKANKKTNKTNKKIKKAAGNHKNSNKKTCGPTPETSAGDKQPSNASPISANPGNEEKLMTSSQAWPVQDSRSDKANPGGDARPTQVPAHQVSYQAPYQASPPQSQNSSQEGIDVKSNPNADDVHNALKEISGELADPFRDRRVKNK